MGFLRKADERPGRRGSARALWLGIAAGFVFLLAGGLQRLDFACREAVVTEAVARELANNTTEGRQALVSSIWWPPLPVLVRLPLAALVQVESGPVASLIVSALFGALSLWLLIRILEEWGLGRVRYLLAAAVAVYPPFLAESRNGSSATIVLFLALMALRGLAGWIEQRSLRGLVTLALAAALLTITSAEAIPWAMLLLGLVALDQGFSASRRWYKEAVLILALLPVVYAFSLWVLMNWLVMGNALYFMRSFLTPAEDFIAPAYTPAIGSRDLAAVGVGLCLAVGGLWRRHRAAAHLGVAVLAPLALALFLASKGRLWGSAPLLFVLFPLSVAAAGFGLRLLRPAPALIRAAVAAVPVVLSTAALLADGPGWRAPAAGSALAPVAEEQNTWLSRVERHVLNQSRYVKVFACGYDSFALMGGYRGSVVRHSLDFNFDKARQDYRGHVLYVLVHRPRGRSGMDSIHWKYPRIYTLGSRSTLYDDDWGEWRLFEIIQAPWVTPLPGSVKGGPGL